MNKLTKIAIFIIPLLVLVAVSWPQLHDFWKKKELSYTVESSKLVQNKGALESEIKFIINEEKYTNLYIGFIKFENTGDIPIKREDFENSISVIINTNEWANLSILLYNVIEKMPQDLNVKLFKSDTIYNEITIEPLLLNPGDKFNIQFVSNQNPSSIHVSSRILGIKGIKEIKQTTKSIITFIQFVNTLNLLLVWYFMMFFVFTKYLSNNKIYINLLATFTTISIIINTVFIFNKSFTENYHWSFFFFYLPGIIIWTKLSWKTFKEETKEAPLLPDQK